jgi:hypothetical protein
VDNGTEFIPVVMDQWACWNGMTLESTRLGEPQDNVLIDAFNSRFRQECIDEHRFLSVADAQEKAEAWREHYDRARPHSTLGNLTPEAFIRQAFARGCCLRLPEQELVTLLCPPILDPPGIRGSKRRRTHFGRMEHEVEAVYESQMDSALERAAGVRRWRCSLVWVAVSQLQGRQVLSA